MARADRLERLDVRREHLEAEYRDALIDGLRTTAAGSWGLFDHQQDRHARARLKPTIDHLAETAEAIDALRAQLGIAPFDLHRDFLAARGRVPPSAVGEPRQAQAWLARLGATT